MQSLKEARQTMAEILLRDASQERISEPERTRAAFDAGYIWLLTALDEPRGGEHPNQALLHAAVSRLNVPHRTIAPALEYLSQLYKPSGAEPMLAEMLKWAARMKALAMSV